MSTGGRYATSLVIFVVAAFTAGLVIGVNIGRSDTPPEQAHERERGADTQEPVKVTNSGQGEDPAQYKKAPDFELVELESGEPVELKDFSGSNLMLFIATTT
jgi:hypothetical protein